MLSDVFSVSEDISIHAPRVGSDLILIARAADAQKISIHAPRVGSDICSYIPIPAATISIHAPRVGSDQVP